MALFFALIIGSKICPTQGAAKIKSLKKFSPCKPVVFILRLAHSLTFATADPRLSPEVVIMLQISC
jgi:hypothetical protein